ncbi:ATP-binding protein [Hahella ganghwensis]|uniref:ATP-binding protein n=1 Tax=Hahella ganghwensis TaxID=286420 RepID=UPI0003802211|nr:ATP-binding protein [Hahella ganghwensis]
MLQRMQKSIVFRIGVLMVAMVTVAIAAMLSSYLIADEADRDAESVNLSGSLRMQSYRVLSTLLATEVDPEYRSKARDQIIKLENRLDSAILVTEADKQEGTELNTRYYAVSQRWRDQIRPRLERFLAEQESISAGELQKMIDGFVDEVDMLVQAYQESAEARVANLRIVQLVALFFTLGLVALSLSILHEHVELPLRVLTKRAEQIGEGDFSGEVELKNQDELGILADTINRMSQQLYRMYDTLETKVREKTRALELSADSLNFLYQMARQINETTHDNIDFQDWLIDLSKITGVKRIELCLKTPEAIIPYEHVRADYIQPLPAVCDREDCEKCMSVGLEECNTEDGNLQSEEVRYGLLKEGIQYGVIVCTLEPGQHLEPWQQQVMQSFADQVTVALSLKNQSEQERREALMNERNVIARELHDSLAQSLSYLKIQVTRLTRVLGREDMEPELLEEITEEIKEGITSAYRQLRELLTTFRLTISEKGLRAAVEHTVESLQEQHSSMNIQLKYSVTDVPFTPNEEIHLLQLVREALQNAVRHSKGSEVQVTLKSDQQRSVLVQIDDNGINIPKDPDKLNHYGLAIMRERTRNLRGELSISRRPEGGTRVQFQFQPDYYAERNRTIMSQA